MDGSTVIIAVYGQPESGKTSFIARCLNLNVDEVYSVTKSRINICGRDISIEVIENPEQVTRAVVAIILHDISCPESYLSLSKTFDMVHRKCPTAYFVVIGTKADLRTSKSVSAAEAETFCKHFQDGNVQYYETAINPPDAIPAIFKEILARPLINLAILKMATVQENTAFVHDTMDWALENGSANILTHLRELGYAISDDLVLKYQDLVVSYLLQEYPLKLLPSYKVVKRPEPDQNHVESELDEDDEPMDVIDHHTPLKVTRTDFLQWSDISLTMFPPSFLSTSIFNLKTLSHIDLSRNCLTSVPVELFTLPGAIFLNISDNMLTSLPPVNQWMKTKLEILMVSRNKIISDGVTLVMGKNHQDLKAFNNLWYLDVSHNALTSCPGWVFALLNLKHLDLSGNEIQVLTSELGNMVELHTLLIDNLPLVDPPPPIPSLGTHTLLSYLHLKSISSQPLNSIRVVVVGPEKVGKTALLNCIRGDSDSKVTPTKGLDVTYWHYKGELLRRKAINIDFWDFSGSPKYKHIYTCFKCSASLHLAVFSINTEMGEVIRWLSDIQSLSKERVPVLIVFTHMDTLATKEIREEFKRKRTEWLKYNMTQNQQIDNSTAFTLLSSTMTQAVKSLQDTTTLDRHSLYNVPPQQAFDRQEYSGNNIPLMPFMLQNPFFVSSLTNDGTSQLRKTLYRISIGSFQTSLSSLNSIGLEVPAVYNQVVSLIKQLQGHLKTIKTEGEQKPFYTYAELQERLRRPLKQLNISGKDFLAALRLLHERGIVYIYDCNPTATSPTELLIAINPQIIGYLLQRTIRAGEAHSESNILPGFLPNVHPNMIWGVDPIVNLIDGNTSSHGISPLQLINFLSSVNILAPVIPGACVVPSLLPVIPVPGTHLELNEMECKRVYLLGYLPSFFWSHTVTRILLGLQRCKLIGTEDDLIPSSPSVTPSRPTNPLITTSEMKLYLWQKNFVLEDTDGSIVWVLVLEGGQLGPESTPFCGRIDILIKAPRVKEARFLRVVTSEIDQLLTDCYPSLLDDSITPLQVEIFIPLTPQWFSNEFSTCTSPSSVSTASDSLKSSSTTSIGGGTFGGGGAHPANRSGSVAIPESKTRSVSTVSIARSDLSLTIHGTLQEAFMSIKTTGTLPSHSGSIIGSPRHSLSAEGEGLEEESEELSINSSQQFKPLPNVSQLSPAQYLVPMWECLQEVYKPVSIQLKNGKLDFRALLPDLLYADFPFTSIIPVPEDYMVGVKIQEDRGMFMRYYYTHNYANEQNTKEMGAGKTFCLQNHVVKLGEDYQLLSSLSCPYIISPAGINISPPVLGMGLAPLGSLKKYMARSDKPLLQKDIHQIALQVLSAIEYLEEKGLSYHCITAESIFMWCADPVLIKLSDVGLTHKPNNCKLCADLKTSPTNEARQSKSSRFNLIMFGLILYEVSVGERPLEGVVPFSVLILYLYHLKAMLNIEAAITHKCRQQPNHQVNGKDGCVKACHVLCLQSVLNLCTKKGEVSIDMIRTRLSLCAGEENWGPLKLTLDIECMLANENSSLVYWASGSRGLVVGTIDPITGELYRHILAEAPTPESGLFANRRGKPVPIAVGHATAIDVSFSTNQLWVGTENGLMGSVYVFDLPDMKNHHYIHLQDAVLSLKVVNGQIPAATSSDPQHNVLVGLANGTIILFMGKSGGQPLKNPLQGPRKVIATTDLKPCLSISTTSSGHFWCGCGNSIEVIESSTLRSLHRYQCLTESESKQGVKENRSTVKMKADVIVLMGVNSRGLWTVTRRSTLLRLWNSVTGELKMSFSIRNVLESGYNEISALLVEGGVVWVGTRNGFLMLLDAAAIEEGKQEKALRALQFCGDGRVKSIASLKNTNSSDLRVLCSLEYPDEVSGCLMRWEYQSAVHHQWQPRENKIAASSMYELHPVQASSKEDIGNVKVSLKSI